MGYVCAMSIDMNLTAMDALGSVHHVAANNVANVNTDGFQAARANLESGPDGEGVRVASLTQDTTPGASVEGREASNVDMGREITGMMNAENAFSANAAVIRADQQTTGYLLDMII